MTLVCIDCGHSIGGAAYGAGDGTGRAFRCGECHERSRGHARDGVTGAGETHPGTAVTPAVQRSEPPSNSDAETRGRFDRWLAESQYVLGRIVPAVFDDRERLKSRLAEAERECEQLRAQLGQLHTEVSQLRNKEAAVAEAFGRVATLLGTAPAHIGETRQVDPRVQRRPEQHGEGDGGR